MTITRKSREPKVFKIGVAPHYCYDWDDLFVKPWHFEATCCGCFKPWQFRDWLRCWREWIKNRITDYLEARAARTGDREGG